PRGPGLLLRRPLRRPAGLLRIGLRPGGRFFRLVSALRPLAVIGGVEPRTLERDRGCCEDLPQSASAAGADREGVLGHLLDDVERVATVTTRVSVGRHEEPSLPTHSLSAAQPKLMGRLARRARGAYRSRSAERGGS